MRYISPPTQKQKTIVTDGAYPKVGGGLFIYDCGFVPYRFVALSFPTFWLLGARIGFQENCNHDF